MNDVLLMDLADCGSPLKIIACILKHHKSWTAPVPIEELARSVNIIDIKELEADGFEGALTTDPDKRQGVILYKAGTDPGRRRFTIAHELGHFLIPSHKGDQRCTSAAMRERRIGTPDQRKESEANEFAAGILMPAPWFRADLQRLGDADVTHVQELKQRYKTSLEATANRYIELTDDTCAFVFSHDGTIRYPRPTKGFPRLGVGKGDPLPAGCASLKAPATPLRVASEWSEVDGRTWLDPRDGGRVPKVLEQTMRLKGGYQVTLLFIDPDALEGIDEEEEIEESWTPRFHR